MTLRRQACDYRLVRAFDGSRPPVLFVAELHWRFGRSGAIQAVASSNFLPSLVESMKTVKDQGGSAGTQGFGFARCCEPTISVLPKAVEKPVVVEE